MAKQQKSAAPKHSRKYDAFPDKIDVRDWMYQPTLTALPSQLINCSLVPAILDQGAEGACTGFALAANINFHLAKNGRVTKTRMAKDGASPRMLYELARMYDEWPGENYEGSSARGTMKGWVAHGVVKHITWKDGMHTVRHFDDVKAKEALDIPAGAYYRVMHRNVRDMHAALMESGILYATLMVHDGWDNPSGAAKTYEYVFAGKKTTIKLPIIERQRKANGGHAIAIVGYTKEGFIIQNSWGKSWGHQGFAILPYEDWMMHASDCWVAQIGVPIDTDLWSKGYADNSMGKQRVAQTIPLEQIRPYVINIGNNGFLSGTGQYWTTESDINNMFFTIGKTAKNWKKKRILLYLHGGLNTEKEVASRIISFRDVCLANEIYPVHIMWETDFWSTLKSSVFDLFTNNDKASANWLTKLRDGTIEIFDRTLELTASKPGTLIWDEMKENARLSSQEKGRAMDFVANTANAAFNTVGTDDKSNWELHIVGHSAGSIFMAHAIDALLRIGMRISTVQFMAPAISIELFNNKLLQHIKSGACPEPVLYILSDEAELDDNVIAYRKSLLFLVSNAFENKREKPLLGMERFINGNNASLKKSLVDSTISKLVNKNSVQGWPNLVIADPATINKKQPVYQPDVSASETHGGFDNDPFTMNAVLWRILGSKPKVLFDERGLKY